jgi:hypothetical protein
MIGPVRVTLIALACVLVVVAVLTVVGVAFVRWPGDIGDYGNGVGSPARVGQTLSVGLADIDNGTSRPLVIDRVQLHRAVGLTLLGAAVDAGSGAVGMLRGWPPTGRRLVPARGHRVPAHRRIDLVIGLLADRPGDDGAEGVDVLYHRRILGVTLKLRDHIGVWIGVCARRGNANCNPPSAPE